MLLRHTLEQLADVVLRNARAMLMPTASVALYSAGMLLHRFGGLPIPISC